MVTDYFFVYSYFFQRRKKIIKNFWDMEIIGNIRKILFRHSIKKEHKLFEKQECHFRKNKEYSLVFLLHRAIRVSRVLRKKKRGKRKRSKAKNENLIGACRNWVSAWLTSWYYTLSDMMIQCFMSFSRDWRTDQSSNT